MLQKFPYFISTLIKTSTTKVSWLGSHSDFPFTSNLVFVSERKLEEKVVNEVLEKKTVQLVGNKFEANNSFLQKLQNI
jgi:hypothetical protein